MFHVLLMLLKILGWILIFLILLIVIVLITPVHYQFRVKKTEEELLYLQVKVNWFISALAFTADYIDQVFLYQCKVIGIQVLGNQPEFLARKEAKEGKKEKDIAKQNKAELSAASLETKHEDPLKERGSEKTEEDQSYKKSSGGKKEVKTDKKSSDGIKETRSGKKGIDEKSVNKKKTGRILSLAEKLKQGKALYEDYHGEALIRKLWSLLGKIIKHVIPRRLSGFLRFGLEDPAATGYVTGILAAFYPAWHQCFSLEPDFQRKCLEAECYGSGRIRPIYMIYLIIWLLLDKNIRRLIRLMLNR